MGLIKAGVGAVGGVLADQWKEFFSCNALSNDVLVAKGNKTVSGRYPIPRAVTMSSPMVRALS